MIIRKGFRSAIDSYSAFLKMTRQQLRAYMAISRTNLLGILFWRGWQQITGVAYSALDAARLGYDVHVVLPACRAIDLDGSMAVATADARGGYHLVKHSFNSQAIIFAGSFYFNICES